MNKKRILVTNDDGIYAEGIQILWRALEKVADVIVVAPDRERSATGHAITLHHPLHVEEIKFQDTQVKCLAINGTPSDCVKVAVEALLETPPDLVISGINRGPNLGTDVLYSGTVSAAIEGLILGIPSIAISLAAFKDADFTYAAAFAQKLVQYFMQNPFPENTLLNVNVPLLDEEDINGVAWTILGTRKYKNIFDKRVDPRGRTYYWLGGELIEEEPHAESDVAAIRNNYISITPIHIDLTDYKVLEDLRKNSPDLVNWQF